MLQTGSLPPTSLKASEIDEGSACPRRPDTHAPLRESSHGIGDELWGLNVSDVTTLRSTFTEESIICRNSGVTRRTHYRKDMPRFRFWGVPAQRAERRKIVFIFYRISVTGGTATGSGSRSDWPGYGAFLTGVPSTPCLPNAKNNAWKQRVCRSPFTSTFNRNAKISKTAVIRKCIMFIHGMHLAK